VVNDNQKGTGLTGGSLTDEVMESSDSILAKGTMGVGQKGLQQFYSPDKLAQLVASVMDSSVGVLDPTAGDGSLLKYIDTPKSFGIEIDKDQIKASEGHYQPLAGDFQHFFSLLKNAMSPWNGIAANPPFGLQWQHPEIRKGKATNSTVFTFMAINRLLDEHGQYVFVCGKNRYERQIVPLSEHEGVYAVMEVPELFEGTREPCVVLFGIHPGNRAAMQQGPLETRVVQAQDLDFAANWVIGLRDKALGGFGHIARHEYGIYHRVEEFKAVQEEYNRRILARIKTREFDAQLTEKQRIQWLPSPFAKLALTQAEKYNDFYGLNGQPVAYFVQNERLWHSLNDACDDGIVTIDPELRKLVWQVVGEIDRYRIPLYSLKPQQRLGFLQDVDSLLCTKSDPERKFKAGERYRLETATKTIIEKEERLVESKKNAGEYVMKTFQKSKAVMQISVSGAGARYVIYDGGEKASQDIAWIIQHFEIPDKGEIATVHPERIAELETLVRSVLEEFQRRSEKWEKTNKASVPFSVREFQVKDIARMLFKGFGLLAWEQGLGKTVGGLAFFRAATKMKGQKKAKKKFLVVTAADLIPQWTREAERFLGKKPEVIKTHGQAHAIARHLRLGGTGMYITNYEALAVNGTLRKNKALPVVTVEEWTKNELVKGTDRYAYWVWADKNGTELSPNGANYEKCLGENWNSDPNDPTKRNEDNYRGHPLERMKALGWSQKPVRGSYSKDGTPAAYTYIEAQFQEKLYKLTSKDICPECHADTKNGWNGMFCESEKPDGSKCGYAHFAVKMKPIASKLSTSFHDGVIMLDEITYIQSSTSKRSIALRGLQARYRLGLTGTPIKNYVDQIFWPLAWCLGYEKAWFPYSYDAGRQAFQHDYCVIESMMTGRRRENTKVLPEVTNLSRFWRMLASCTIRRRAEETGEKIVDIFYHDVKVPFSIGQAEVTGEWLKKLPHGFPAFFAEKYPEHPVVKAGMHDIMAPLLGLNWKLDYACTLPKADPEWEWTGIELSNWTPANLRTLELAMALAKNGRKVLVGSHIVAEGEWLAERLEEKGVKAVHIVDNGVTIEAKDRAKRVYAFQTDPSIQVFCAGMKAIRLGHNLDAANAVVLNGLDFDYETLDQFIKRVRRLTSTQPVDVYVVLPTLEGQHTITTRKWELLGRKGGAADLALDGRLILKNENEISEADMIRQLQDRGFTVTDEAMDEAEIKRAWELTPHLDDFVVGNGIIPPRPEKVVEEEDEGQEEEVAETADNSQAVVEVEPEADDSFLDEAIEEAFEVVIAEMVEEMTQLTVDGTEEPVVIAETEAVELVPEPMYPEDLPVLIEGQIDLDEVIAESGIAQEEVANVTNFVESPLIPESTESTELSTTEISTPTEGVEEKSPLEPPAVTILDPVATLKGAKELLDLGIIEADEYAAIRVAQLKLMGVGT
jgi:SNF2 family DNA or RNA helicase